MYDELICNYNDLKDLVMKYKKINSKLQQEIELLQNDLDNANSKLSDLMKSHLEAIENCKKSIESINQKLQDDKTIKVVDGKVVNMNEYQIVRLKAIRMKCKELLEILGDKENE